MLRASDGTGERPPRMRRVKARIFHLAEVAEGYWNACQRQSALDEELNPGRQRWAPSRVRVEVQPAPAHAMKWPELSAFRDAKPADRPHLIWVEQKRGA